MLVYNTYCVQCPLSADKAAQVMRIMENAFPPTERRVSEAQYALLKHPLYVVHTLENQGQIRAFMAVWNLSEVTFLEHFAVDAAFRNLGLGGRMLDDLRAKNARVVLEVELPTDELTRRRIAFYRRHGMHLNEREYCQLPLRTEDAPTPMYLMSSPSALNEAEFVRIRREIYRHVYGVTEV